MDKITLIIGGCRSGKSIQALVLAKSHPGPRMFLATCLPADDEMHERVAKHRQERGTGWETIESPYFLPQAIRETSGAAGVLVVDCLTLWASNLIIKNEDPDDLYKSVRELTLALKEAVCPVILVSNEVGCGIVPENKLARKFRDLVGMVNQNTAASADQVIWMVAGIPVVIKSGGKKSRE